MPPFGGVRYTYNRVQWFNYSERHLSAFSSTALYCVSCFKF